MNAHLTSPPKGSSRDIAAFAAIAAIARAEAGLLLDPTKESMVRSRLRSRIKALGLNDFADYCDYVSSPDGKVERRQMISALTTNVSHFFREMHHFELLRQKILPALVHKAKAGGKVRIWSAGCSSGQEPYSIAMCLLTGAPDLSKKDVLVLASDIDPKILHIAKAGVYSSSDIKGIPHQMRDRFLVELNDGSDKYVVNSELKDMVRFKELNLLHDWPMQGTFDVIFCRNVVIYFDADTQADLWPRFRAKLADDGAMFIGHSERISTSYQHEFETIGLTSYRPTAAGEPGRKKRAFGDRKPQPVKE